MLLCLHVKKRIYDADRYHIYAHSLFWMWMQLQKEKRVKIEVMFEVNDPFYIHYVLELN